MTFFVVEPAAGYEQTFVGDYPAEEVLGTIGALDLSTGDYHLKDGLFATELFCKAWDGPHPILGAYVKDMYASVTTERKGEIREVEMDDGEGVVDATFVAFLPGSVAAMVRTSVKSPGSARVANWLSRFGGHPCYFAALPTVDTMARLDRPSSEVSSLVLRAKRGRLPAIRSASPKVAEALEAASRLSGSSKVGLHLGVAQQKEKPAWWNGVRDLIGDLVEVLPEFDTARVEVVRDKNINLLDAYVSTRVTVEMDGKRRVRPLDAAMAMMDAYQTERESIRASLEARRRR